MVFIHILLIRACENFSQVFFYIIFILIYHSLITDSCTYISYSMLIAFFPICICNGIKNKSFYNEEDSVSAKFNIVNFFRKTFIISKDLTVTPRFKILLIFIISTAQCVLLVICICIPRRVVSASLLWTRLTTSS